LNFEKEFFMKITMTTLMTIGILLGLTATTFAGHKPNATARKRQYEQQQRVRQGVRSGELTKVEVRSLEREQRKINQGIRQAHADGIVTLGERRDIQQEQNQASRHITRAKHNRRDRN